MGVEQEAVCRAVKTNLRAETAPVPQYLLSRSVAGKNDSKEKKKYVQRLATFFQVA